MMSISPTRRRDTNTLLDPGPYSSSPRRARVLAVEKLTSNGFPYSRTLSAHTACVNALAFSPGGARWLASAGDDPFVYLWDFHQEDIQPARRFVGPRANVFALAFSATSQYLYSGDTNDVIHQFDISRLSTESSPGTTIPTNNSTTSFHHHTDSIRALSCHPTQEQTFLSASEDGLIILYDSRQDARTSMGVGCVGGQSEFTGVQWHPTMPHVFVGSDAGGRVRLWDARAAFGRSGQRREEKTQGVVLEYATKVRKKGVRCLKRPEASSVVFDATGSRLAVTMFHYHPTIYAVNDPNPIATCSARTLPDGSPIPADERTYSNSCTIKHGSFGGAASEDGMFYAAGSDDFRAYVWRMPSVEQLREERRVLNSGEWADLEDGIVGFKKDSDVYGPTCVPVELSTPHSRLTGHRSIVNTALLHPYTPRVLTAGIERNVLLHSAVKNEGMQETPREVRRLESVTPAELSIARVRREWLSEFVREDAWQEGDEEEETIALFDDILRQEGGRDMFAGQSMPSVGIEEEDEEGTGADEDDEIIMSVFEEFLERSRM